MFHKTQAKTGVKKILQFEFISFESLIFFAKRFLGFCEKNRIKSDLYLLNHKYIIILHTKPIHTKNIFKFCPLADSCTMASIDISVTLEHAKLITSENAIEKINDSF